MVLGLVAGAFGTIPDLDMLYAVTGLTGGLDGPAALSAGFWAAAEQSHRGATHSLVIGGLASGLAAVWVWRGPTGLPGHHGRWRVVVGGGLSIALVATTTWLSGPLTGAIMAVFLAAVATVARLGARAGLGGREVFAVAALGLLTHPFGDVFTGGPPAFLYPLDVEVLAGKVHLVADPTLSLLVPFFLELAVLWLGYLALADLRGWRGIGVRPAASLGGVGAGAVVVLPAPTLEHPSLFVATVLGLGTVGALIAWWTTADRDWRIAATALATITLAGLAYGAAYLVAG